MKLEIITINKISKEEEVFERDFSKDEISCFYKDRNGVYVSTMQGKIFKVKISFLELSELYEKKKKK